MKDTTEAYLATVDRLEPDLSPVDQTAALTSIAISVKRIEDTLETLTEIVRAWVNSR